MNEQKPRRSLFSTLLPYILTAVVVGFIIWWAVSLLSNNTVTLSASELDAFVGYQYSKEGSSFVQRKESDGDSGSVYIYNYTASTSYEVTVVSGTYVPLGEFDSGEGIYLPSKTGIAFTVTISNNRWFNDWTPVPGASVQHLSYQSIFEYKVDEWNAVISANPDLRLPEGSYGEHNAFEVSWWDAWGPTIITLLIVVVIGAIFISRVNSTMGGGNRQVMDFTKASARREASRVRFSDVAGCDEEKAEMVEMVDYLKEPKKYSKFGARLPKGVLLIGPPGTGKTLLAKAVAGEAGVPFYSISGSDFVEMFVGVGAGRVRDLFRKAKQTAPCIVFIDEIDAVGRQRGAGLGGGNDEREQTLNQLLVEMDGFEYNSGILVMAATNRDDVLDPALTRPGRFDRTITVSLPDRAGREAIFKVHARNKKILPDVNFAELAKETVGFSGADIENILNEAAILAVRFNKDGVGMAEIDEAIDRRIAGPAKSGRGMTKTERKIDAYHEAGHAVIGLVLPHSEKVQKITIVPRGNTGGHVLMTPEDDRFLLTKKELIAQITGLLGGRSAEEIFFDDISTGAENDIQQATRLARLMVTNFGMSDLGPIQYERSNSSVFLGRDYMDSQKNFSTQVAYEIDKAVREIIETAHRQAIDILQKHRADVELIANTLLEKETITAEEIESLVKTGALPKKDKAEPAAEKAPETDGKAPSSEKKGDGEKPSDPEKKEDGTSSGPEAPKEGADVSKEGEKK